MYAAKHDVTLLVCGQQKKAPRQMHGKLSLLANSVLHVRRVAPHGRLANLTMVRRSLSLPFGPMGIDIVRAAGERCGKFRCLGYLDQSGSLGR